MISQLKKINNSKFLSNIITFVVILNAFYLGFKTFDIYQYTYYYFDLFFIISYGIETLIVLPYILFMYFVEGKHHNWALFMQITNILILLHFFGLSVVNLMLLRLLRLLRILKITNNNYFVKYSFKIIREKTKEIINSILLIYSVFIFIFSYLLYVVENESNNSINNILDAIYFVIITATTVGFGDITPETSLGRIIIAVVAIFGVGLFGAIIGIITTSMDESIQKTNRIKERELKNKNKSKTKGST